MEIRDSEDSRGTPPRIFARLRISCLSLFPAILTVLLIGCAAPGEPLERRPPVPSAISDLAAEQSANDVVLTFTLPTETVDHRALKSPPAIEIYRDFVAPSPSPGSSNSAPAANGAPPVAALANPTLLVTIPSAVVDRYSDRGHVRYDDSLKTEDFSSAGSGRLVRYIVRTRATQKKDSSDSNVTTLAIYPAADSIADVKTEVTHDGVILTWTPPQRSPAGPAPPIAGYNIYRSEPQSVSAAPVNPDNPALKSPLVKVGENSAPSYQDTQAELGHTYVYSVRSRTQYPGEMLESADSKFAIVLARDTFPPATPQGLVLVLVPAQGGAPAHVELSWAISPETDLAGYNVYRSGQSGVPGERLNSELLPTPAFRDMSAVPGRQYVYTVTAVDRSGNESAASDGVSGGIPAESRTQ